MDDLTVMTMTHVEAKSCAESWSVSNYQTKCVIWCFKTYLCDCKWVIPLLYEAGVFFFFFSCACFGVSVFYLLGFVFAWVDIWVCLQCPSGDPWSRNSSWRISLNWTVPKAWHSGLWSMEDLWKIEQFRVSLLLHSINDTLPSPTSKRGAIM